MNNFKTVLSFTYIIPNTCITLPRECILRGAVRSTRKYLLVTYKNLLKIFKIQIKTDILIHVKFSTSTNKNIRTGFIFEVYEYKKIREGT